MKAPQPPFNPGYKKVEASGGSESIVSESTDSQGPSQGYTSKEKKKTLNLLLLQCGETDRIEHAIRRGVLASKSPETFRVAMNNMRACTLAILGVISEIPTDHPFVWGKFKGK